MNRRTLFSLRRTLTSLALTSVVAALPYTVQAAPAAPHTYTLDVGGQQMTVRNKGNEWTNWIETEAGYAIAPDASGKYFYVSQFAGNAPVLSNVPATSAPPVVLQKHVSPSVMRSMPLPSAAAGLTTPAAVANSPTGAFKGKILFILVKFNDQNSSTTESSWGSFVKNNIKDFYYKASNKKVQLIPATETSGTANNGVIGWLPLNRNHPNNAGNIDSRNQTLSKQAIIAADPYIDYASYDTNQDGYVDSDELSVVVIVAGQETAYGSSGKSVWGHAWYIPTPPIVDGVKVGTYHRGQFGYAQFGEKHGTHQATMGIMVHELGHLTFGLPDLYDTDYTSGGAGSYCVMSGSSWGYSSTNSYQGQTPVLPSAWIKKYLKWSTPTVASGTATLTAAGSTLATPANTIRRASTSKVREYFLVENRQLMGYDRGLEGLIDTTNFGGLAIWHIDDSRSSNSSDAHRWVDLEKADNTEAESATDLWYAGNATTFNGSSIPNSNNYAGSATNVNINSISASGETMTANFQ